MRTLLTVATAVLLAAHPSSAPAEEPLGGPAAGPAVEVAAGSFLGGYAILARDPSTGQTGVAIASNSFSAGSGLPWLELDAGAVAVLDADPAAAERAALEALRSGGSAEEALAAARGAGAGDAPIAVLDGRCGRAAREGGGAYRWSGTERGSAGTICYVAVGSLLPDPALLDRAVGAFADSSGSMVERMHAFLAAADRTAGDVPMSRSAAIWIDAPDAESGALGRARLRLQVEDVQRPGDALRVLMRAARADAAADLAGAAVDAGDHARAIQLADRALEADPASAAAWMARGRALLYRGDEEEAETAFQRMLEVNPYLLHLLGDPATDAEDRAPTVRQGTIPYRPRLLQRLDVYRRAFFRGDVEFGEEGS